VSALRVKHGRRYRPATRDEVLEAAATYLVEERRGQRIVTVQAGVLIARHLVAGRDYESFGAAFLTTRHTLITAEVLFRGTVDGATVYPREVVKRALQLGAAAVIVFHNHPSGDPTPSEADRKITKKLREALRLVDVRLLDHVVVTNASHVSFAERRWV